MARLKSIYVIVLTMIIVLPFTHAVANSDTPSESQKNKIVVPFISFGGAGIEVDAMNNQLTQNGYRRFKDYSFLLGGGFYKKFGRSILEFEIRGIRWNTRERGSNQSSLKGVNGLVNYGFNVLPKGTIALFPYVGGGFGKVWLDLTTSSTPFDSLLTKPVTDVTLDQKTFLLNAGIGFDITIARKKNAAKDPLTIGIRGGYMFDPTDNNDWYENDTAVKGGPKLSLNGLYARIILGKSIQKPWQRKSKKE